MANEPLDVASFLDAHREAIVSAAHQGIERRGLAHYRAAGPETTRARMEALYDVVTQCCREHRLEPGLDYGRSLALERHAADHSLGEVQAAINTLEEALWHAVTRDTPAESQGYALALVSTVLGAVKDRLACTYVEEVSSRHLTTLRVESLFGGSEGNVHPV